MQGDEIRALRRLQREQEAATIVAKIFQQIWPPLMIGAMVTLEVGWILFLVAFVRLVLPGGR
jgi:hypothetical protein